MKYIKLGIRYNLLHIALSVLFTFLREIVQIIMSRYYNFKCSFIYCELMFLSEIVFGLVFLLIYSKIHSKKKIESDFYRGKIELINERKTLNKPKANNFFLPLVLWVFNIVSALLNDTLLPVFMFWWLAAKFTPLIFEISIFFP